MEDVRRRFGGMSFSGVPMNDMSEFERKLAEMKVGVDDCVDHATVLLGSMRFGGTASSSPEKTVRTTPSKSASRRRPPDREGATGITGSDCAPNGLHAAGGGGGRGRNNVSAHFQDTWTTNESKVHPDPMRFSTASPTTHPESWRPFEKRNLFHKEGGGFDTPNVGATRVPTPVPPRVSVMGEERSAAEKAFAALDQNSGRVSTPAFEELLTLLGVPAERRKGDATESARAAGLLSSYSFSRNDFMNWYLVWRFKGCTPSFFSPGVSSNGCNGAAFPLPKFDSWKRSKPSFNSPSSSDNELSFSLKAAAAFRAAVAAVSASPDATDSSDHATREAASGESESKDMGKNPGVFNFDTIRDILLDDSTGSASVASAHGKRGSAEFNVGNPDPNRRSKSSHGSMDVPKGDILGNNLNEKSKSGIDGIGEQKTHEGNGSAPGVSPQAPFRAANFTATVAASDGLPKPQPSKEPLKFNCGAKAEQAASGLPSHRQNGRLNGVMSDKGPRILRRSAAALRKERAAVIGKSAADMTRPPAENVNIHGSTSNPVLRSGQTPGVVTQKEQPKPGRHAQAPQTIPTTKATPAVCTPGSTAPTFVFGPAMTPTKPTVTSPPSSAPLFNFGYSPSRSVQPPPTPPSSTFSVKIAGGLPTTPLPTYAATSGEGTFATGTTPRTQSSTRGRRRQRGLPSKASSLTPPPPPGRSDHRGGHGMQNGGTGLKAASANTATPLSAAGIFASCFSPVASSVPSPPGISSPLNFFRTAVPATEETEAGPLKMAGVGSHNTRAPSNPSLKDDLVPNAWSTPEPVRTYESYSMEAPSGDKFNVKRSAPGFHPGTTGRSMSADDVSAPKSTIKRNNTGFHVGTTGTNKSTASKTSRASAKGNTSAASKSSSPASYTSTPPVSSKGVQSSRIFTFSVGNKGSKCKTHNSVQKVVQQQGGSQTDLKPPSISTKDATEMETAVRGMVANESSEQERFEVGTASAATKAFQKAWVKGMEQERERQTEEREREKRRKEAEEILAKLKVKHEADKERARRTYMDMKSFEAAVVDYTDAINSLEDVMYHMKLHGDEHEETDVIIEERKRLAPLLWSRAAAHIMIGRYRSAVTDCALALEANKDFDQAYPRMGKALMMTGDLEESEKAFFLGIRQDPCPEDLRNHKDCRDGIVNLETIRAHLENAKRNLDGKQHMRAIASADRALMSSPNLEGAQTLIVKVLMKDKNWEETRRRCEVWAYKLDSSTCVGKIMSLQGFAEGGGPPRACLRAMYASIREAYVKSLRNAGLTEAFKEALDEATATGVAWATTMTRRRQQVIEKKERAGEAYASKQYCIAEDLYTEALAIDGEDFHTNALLHANRAAARMNLGRNKDALKDCEQALKLKPMYPKMLLRKARLQKRLCYWEEAIKNFESYRNTVGILHETWREAAAELDECRLNLRKARDEERRKDEGARFRSREHTSRKTNFDDDYFPSGSDGEYDDPFNFFNRAFRSGRRAAGRYGTRSEESVTTPSSGHYATLGLQSSATIAEVKKAYRKLALQHHPDKNQGNADAADRFREITAAYEVLSDEKERRTYDATLRSLAHLRG